MSSYDWRDLQLVAAVSEHGSLTAAGKALNVAPSTISRRLDALEASLGVELFSRHPNGYTLTERGNHLVKALSPMLEGAEEWARRAFSSEIQEFSYVRLSAPSLVLAQMSGVCAEFFAEHPNVKLTILEENDISDLGQGGADLAIRVIHQPEDHLWGYFLGEIELAVAASPEYLSSLTSMEDARWIVNDYSVAKKTVSRWERSSVDPSKQLVETNSRHVALELVRLGCGLGVLPKRVVELDPLLVVAREIELEHPLRLWFLTLPERKDDPELQKVMRFFAAKGRLLL